MLTCVRGWFDAEMVWDATASGKKGRQQAYTDAAIQTCLTMKVLFGLPLRQTTGFMESLLKLAGLNWTVPDFSTLCRRQKTLSVAIPFRGSSGPLHLLIDSTGIKAEAEGEWNARKHGGPKRRPWRKIHIGIDEETLEIRAVEVTSSSIGDAPMRPDLLDQIPQDEEIGSVTGDEATIPANATMQLQLAMPMRSFHRVRMRSCGGLTRPEPGRETKLFAHQSIWAAHYGGK